MIHWFVRRLLLLLGGDGEESFVCVLHLLQSLIFTCIWGSEESGNNVRLGIQWENLLMPAILGGIISAFDVSIAVGENARDLQLEPGECVVDLRSIMSVQ